MKKTINLPKTFYTADCGIGDYLINEKLVYASEELNEFLKEQVDIISSYEDGDPMVSENGHELYFVNTSVFIVAPNGDFILPEKELQTIVEDLDPSSTHELI